jgi:hypothetical protein
LASHHLSGAVALHNRSIVALNAFVAARSNDARTAAAADVRAAQADLAGLGAGWHGDPSVRDAVAAELAWDAAFLDGDAVKLTTEPRTKDEADAYNAAVRALNEGRQATIAAFEAAAASFRQRWQFDAYRATADARQVELERWLKAWADR